MSPDEFSDLLSSRYHSDQFAGKPSLEIDMSKFDKSQGSIALLFECRMTRIFCVSVV